ncbi:hypothetical protein C8R46DRAFT_1209198 [Mycena filopes]|nr:hypothetical protein C8R46DRAFT_1209198 [Mycena filopes]
MGGRPAGEKEEPQTDCACSPEKGFADDHVLVAMAVDIKIQILWRARTPFAVNVQGGGTSILVEPGGAYIDEEALGDSVRRGTPRQSYRRFAEYQPQADEAPDIILASGRVFGIGVAGFTWLTDQVASSVETVVMNPRELCPLLRREASKAAWSRDQSTFYRSAIIHGSGNGERRPRLSSNTLPTFPFPAHGQHLMIAVPQGQGWTCIPLTAGVIRYAVEKISAVQYPWCSISPHSASTVASSFAGAKLEEEIEEDIDHIPQAV